MNRLKIEDRARIVNCLVEGCSMRSTTRLTGAAKKTVSRILVEVGEACAAYHDKIMRNFLPDSPNAARDASDGGWYLTRLVLQNRYFADDIQLLSLVRCDEKLRVLTTQPHVPGEAALAIEIQGWFYAQGYKRLEIDNCVAWYRELDNLLVADAHEGNVIRTENGTLFAIDLNLIKPCGQMLEMVLSLLPVSGMLVSK